MVNNDDIISLAINAGADYYGKRNTGEPMLGLMTMDIEKYTKQVVELVKRKCIESCQEVPIPDTIEGAHPDYLEGKRMAVHQCIHNINQK